MVGLGAQEILILAVLGGGALVVAVVIGLASRGGSRARTAERENERLREENERLRNRG